MAQEANELAVQAAEVADSTAAQAPVEGTPQGADTPDASPGTAPEGGTPVTPAPEKTFTQAELDEIISKRIAKEHRKALREADRRIAEALAGWQQPPAQTSSPGAAQKPDPTKFPTTEEYIHAVGRWEAGEQLRVFREEQAQQAAEAKRQQDMQAARLAHIEREEAAREKYSDYEDVALNPTLPISEIMAGAIRLSPKGPDIAYYLGKNPTEAARIANLPPFFAAVEIGAITAKLTAAPAAPTPTPSKAPPPITPLSGSTVNASDEPRDSDPVDVWMKKREAQLARERANR